MQASERSRSRSNEMITKKNIVMHELIGLDAKVEESGNRSLAGMHGEVVNETRNMLTLQTSKGERNVPKEGSVFTFKLPKDGAVRVEGGAIAKSPEKRLKARIKKW